MQRSWTVFACSLVCSFLSFSSFAQLPDNYQNLLAVEKRALLWTEITQSHEENPLPTLTENNFKEVLRKLRGLFNLSTSFDHASDEMPKDKLRIIHINGSVGLVSIVPAENHPFTGIYKTGGMGLARLSLGVTPSDTNYVPGIAVKIVIDKHASINMHAINSLEGQKGNWNFFANDFSNQIPPPSTWILKAIETIFQWTRDPANVLPLWHFAAWTTEGHYEGIPVYPERIYFRPSDLVKHLIPEDSREDFRVSLSSIPEGPLYELYGEYQGREYHIGTLVLESTLVASDYGDKILFFQHQR